MGQVSIDAIMDTILTDLNRFIVNPDTRTRKIEFEFFAQKKGDGIHIHYPGPDGQQETIKSYET